MRTKVAKCLNNAAYPVSLEPGKRYQVVPDSAGTKLGQIRIVDESGEDYLYPEEYFIDE